MLKKLAILHKQTSRTDEIWGYVRDLEKQATPIAIQVYVFRGGLTKGDVHIQKTNVSRAEDLRLQKLNSGYVSITGLASAHLYMSVSSEHIAVRIHAALQAASPGDEEIVLAHTIGVLKAEFGERQSAIQEERSKAVLSGLLQTIPASLRWNW